MATACTFPPPPTLKQVLPQAKYVFVFRLESVELQRDRLKLGDGQTKAIGHFSIVRSFRGKPTYKHISFATQWCGGNRLDVGHYFLIAASGAGDTIELTLADETVLDITNEIRGRPVRLYKALSRGTLPPGFPSRSQSNYTLTFGYPN